MRNVTLILDDGSRFSGKSFGYEKPVAGEVVFNTAMTGYPESLTDPSYAGQLMTLTYPLVGNYGVPPFTIEPNGLATFMESEKIHAEAIIVSDYSYEYSHWNAVESLGDWLKREKVPGITGIDTRELTKVLREHGVMMGKIVFENEELRMKNEEFPSYSDINYVDQVSCKEIIHYFPRGPGGGRGGDFDIAARGEGPARRDLERVGREPHDARRAVGLPAGKKFLLVIAPAADGIAPQHDRKIGPETVGAVIGLQAERSPAQRQRIIVAEAVALADRPSGMPQVILQQIAVRIVVDQEAVDVRNVPGAQQIAHLLVGTGVFAAERNSVAERQPDVGFGGERRVESEVAVPADTAFHRIGRMSARHAVLADQLVPVDLRVARIAGEPRLLGLPVARIAGQIPVIVGHRRAGVVPVEHTVLRDARLGGKRGGERGRSRQRHGIGGQGQRNRLAPHAGVAHPGF